MMMKLTSSGLMLRKCVPFASRELVITISWSRVHCSMECSISL